MGEGKNYSQAKKKIKEVARYKINRGLTVAPVYMYISSKAVGQVVRHQEDEKQGQWH